MDVMAIAVYLCVGMVTGLLSGLFGIGGGLIVVPSLSFLFSVEHFDSNFLMHLAVGTSLAIMAVTTTNAVRQHSKQNSGYFPIFNRLLVGLVPGIFAGAILSHYLHGHVLRVIFGVLTLLVSVSMVLPASNKSSVDNNLPRSLVVAAGFFIGAVSSLLGVGGGFITVPFLRRYDIPLHLAIMVSAMVGLTVGLIGCVANIYFGWGFVNLPHWSTGYVYWPAFIGISIGTLFTVPLGAKLAYRLSVDKLHTLFAVFLFCMGIHMMM